MAKAKSAAIILTIYTLLSSLLAAQAGTQAGTQAVDRARVLYNGGSFQEAYDLIVSRIPENSADANLRKSAASLLAYMGVSEYEYRNFKNAYASFSQALDYQPDNAVAAQYARRMQAEMNVSTLRNEGEADSPGPAASTSPIGASELQSLIGKVWEEEEKLSRAEKLQSAEKENEALRRQLEQQRSLNDETIQLLQRIAEKQADAASRPDPALQALTTAVGDQTEILKSGSRTSALIAAALVILGSILLGTIALIAVLAVRARKLRPSGAAPEVFPGFAGPALPGAQTAGLATPERILLEYSGGDGPAAEDSSIQRLALRAARLQRLVEEAKLGKGWDAVRSCMDELDPALKAEILQMAEDKLEQGDLLSNQAVLPVIFPFLSEDDDYLRGRAEGIASSALLGDEAEGASGPFSVKSLMRIPEKLRTVLLGRDQSIATAKLSRSIARQMGFSEEDARSIYKATIAHDAGYLMLEPDRLAGILQKKELDAGDFEFIKSHTLKGPDYFEGQEIPEDIRDAMLYHHERNDGSGYPNGFRRDQIPLFARVIGVAESYIALMANRPDREKLGSAGAMAIIRDARTKFDRDIVDALGAVVNPGGAAK